VNLPVKRKHSSLGARRDGGVVDGLAVFLRKPSDDDAAALLGEAEKELRRRPPGHGLGKSGNLGVGDELVARREEFRQDDEVGAPGRSDRFLDAGEILIDLAEGGSELEDAYAKKRHAPPLTPPA
jgi:hypothetical protein